MAVYCGQCGKQSSEDCRFCSNCGRPLTAGVEGFRPDAFGGRSLRTLVRPRAGRKVAGVCQGLANHYGWDVTVVRIVMLLLAITTAGTGLILYAVIWLVAPEEPFALPSSTSVSQS